MGDKNIDIEDLRHRLLDEVYALTFSGAPAAFLDVSKIEQADGEELIKIAAQYGLT